MIEWHKSEETKPADNQMCWLSDGDQIAGPFPWKSPHGWIDLFATAEAGQLYDEKNCPFWTEESNINLPMEG